MQVTRTDSITPGTPGVMRHQSGLLGSRRIRRDRLTAFLFLLPATVVLLVTTVYPIAYSLWLSTQAWNPLFPTSHPTFIGLDNYASLVTDPAFWENLGTTIRFVAGSVGSEFLLGLAIALVITSPRLRLVSLTRTSLFIPIVMTPVVIGILWGQLFNSKYGVINDLLSRVGLPPQEWLGSPEQALPAVIAVDVWQYLPVVALILAAGLQSLPAEVLEASRVDGASSWQTFRHVTLPLLKRVMIVVLLIRVMDAFKTFDTIFVMTQGGPVKATNVMSIDIYITGLKYFDVGLAAAQSFIFLIIVGTISGSLLYVLHRLDKA